MLKCKKEIINLTLVIGTSEFFPTFQHKGHLSGFLTDFYKKNHK